MKKPRVFSMSITPFEYSTSLILTIILLFVKALTASYLGYKIYLRRKETKNEKNNFFSFFYITKLKEKDLVLF
ncbi:MAG: hypothetical protein BAJALOKI3v1_30009 [Promethearchaeota archaeon]|nr:MAG: hypothetical protein BAJALOKI3v1_30009 [Candidatus Lokiarchaeota archaeon]